MKRIKLFMPLAVATTAITPVTMITSCGNANITIENKTLSVGDSLVGYKFKMANIPSDKKVTVNVINKSEAQEQVYLYEPYSTTNGKLSTLTCSVSDDGTVVVPAGYYLAPSQSASSEFGLAFTYKNGDKEVTDTVDGLKFNYNVDYGAELKDGNYPAQSAKASWGSDVGEEYESDILSSPNIFQNDARYSTSQRIKEAVVAEQFKNLDSFKAYFNDIVQEGDGMHVHMNYQIKGTQNDSYFSFTQGTTKWEFENFDFSFTFETPNGYVFKDTSTKTADYRELQILDPLSQTSPATSYALDGRFKGTFKYTRTVQGEDPQTKVVTYDGLINNYELFQRNELSWYTDAQVAGMLCFGIIHLTYGFSWEASVPTLTIRSTYAKNVA